MARIISVDGGKKLLKRNPNTPPVKSNRIAEGCHTPLVDRNKIQPDFEGIKS